MTLSRSPESVGQSREVEASASLRTLGTARFCIALLSIASACDPGRNAPDAQAVADVVDDTATDAAIDAGDPGAHLPAAWSLAGPGITIEISRRPYGYRVLDATGANVVSTIGSGTGDGYGSVGWTGGTVRFRPNGLGRGYADFTTQLEPWRDGWHVVDAHEREAEVELVLARDTGTTERMVVSHRLRANASFRFEARLEGGTPRAWTAGFATPSNEGFLGFGERFTRTNQRGVNVYSWAEEGGIGRHEGEPVGTNNPGPYGESMSYYPVPFFVSTRGYGFWLDTTHRSQFNLATDRDDAWRVWHIGPSLAYEIYLQTPGDARPWPYQVIDRFTERTGRPMLPPPWTLGPRRRINRGAQQLGVSEIQAMRDQDLAITAVDDAMHFLPAGSHVGLETELAAWTAEGRRLGYRTNGYFNSLVSSDPASPIRAEVVRAISNRWVLHNAAGPSEVVLVSGRSLNVLQVDFTSRDATAWFQSAFHWALDLGYSGWMYDFGEYVQSDITSASGMSGEELHNLYPVLYQKAAYDALEAGSTRGDWLTFARSGYTGASQWSPMVWTGDPAASFEEADGLPSMPRTLINLGISGVPNTGGDISGFHCIVDGYEAANEELLVRWIQQGSMSVNMQDQSACFGARGDGAKSTIWRSMAGQQAWREYARLHTRLFPYLNALTHQAHATGAPVLRHMFLEHPDRIDLAGADDQYYFGPALLVAPVVHRGERARDVVLPAGRYLDWREQRLYEGGTVAHLDVPLEKLPLFLRDGHLVPMLDPRIDTLAAETHAGVIGPADVADVYDVVGLVSVRSGAAAFTLADGDRMDVRWSGAFADPALPRAVDVAELSTCAGCWERTMISPGLSRVRISTTSAEIAAGGLRVRASTARRVRWDLYLVD